MAKVAIFGSRVANKESIDWQNAKYLGRVLSNAGFDIITGAYGGIMEAAFSDCNDNVKKIGVVIEGKTPNKYVTEVYKTKDYFSRLNKLLELADAYIVLPGGTGTFLEFAAVWALKERGVIDNKPLIAIGDMWSEIFQIMAFYNERIIEHFDKVATMDNAEEAATFIINFFKEKKI